MAVPQPRLEYYNPITTALNDSNGITTSDASIVVDDASKFVVGCIAFIGTEQMKVTDITSNTLTVKRGVNGTTAATHNDNAPITVGWIEAETWAGNNAILFCTITKALNQPSVAEVILTNRSKDPSSTDTSKSTGNLSDPTGEKATLFSDFQDCRIIDNETQQCLFRGRIYNIRNQYDLQYGNTVKLILKDMLKELDDLPIDDAPPSLRGIILDTYDSRSKLIGKILNGLSDNFASVTNDTNQTAIDTLKFSHSAHAFTANEKRTGDTNASNEYLWDIVTGKSEALSLIHDFAKQDPHDSATVSKHFGYDFYVDSNINSNLLSSYGGDSGKVSFNYFKRGSRPAASVNTHGLTIEYPSSGWGGQTGFRRSMLTDAEFSNPSGMFFTGIVGHFEDSGRSEGNSDETPVKIHKAVASYELIKGSITSGYVFEWQGRRMQFIKDAPTIEEEDDWGDLPPNGTGETFLNTTTPADADDDPEITVDGTEHVILPGQSINPKNPLLLYKTGSATPCATVQYQSGTGSDSFLVVGNVYDTAQTYTDPQGNTLDFEAFPKTATNLYTTMYSGTHNPQARTSDNPYITLIANSRARDRHDINKPKRFQIRNLEDYDPLRKQIAAILDRSAKDAVTIGKVRVSRYPYTKVIALAANVARSSNILTFSTQNSVNAFAYADGSGTTNDPRDFGAKKGMIVAQLTGNDGSDSAIARAAYITDINATTITYGASATDTIENDVTLAITPFDTSKDIAIFVPTETGHIARFKNNLYGVNYEVLIQKIQYNFSPGILTTTLEGIGLNNNDTGVPGVPSNIVDAAIVSGEEDKGFSFNLPPTTQKWQILDGLLTAVGTNKVDLTSINEGRFVTLRTLADGKEYQIDVADDDLDALNGISFPSLVIGATDGDFGHANTTAEEHVIFYRTKGARYNSRKLQAVAVKRTSGTGGKIWSEIETKHDIVIGTAIVNADGLVLTVLEGGAFGTYGQLDIRVLGTNRLTNALLKKGAQPFTTSIQFLPCQANGSASNATHTNAVYNAFRWTTGSISFGQDATNTIAIADGHQASLSASTSYFAYLTIPTSGGGTISVTDDYRIPFDDDKVLLATVVVSADPSEVGHSPTILPIAGKQLTISAVNMTANAIVADTLAANSITADKITAGSLNAFEIIGGNIKTPAANVGQYGAGAGIKISSDGIEGFSGGTTKTFFLNPATGTVTIGGGQDGSDGSDGAAGTNAYVVRLSASKYVIPYNIDGGENTSLVFTAAPQGIVGTATYLFQVDGVTKQSASTTATYTMADGDEPASGATKLVKVTMYDNGVSKATDSVSVYGVQDGEDAITVIMTNEAHALPTTAAGEVTYTNSGTDIRVFRGSTALAYHASNASTFSVSASASNITAGGASTVSTYTRRFGIADDITQPTAKITFTITVRNALGTATAFTKVQTINKTTDGDDGAPGSRVFRTSTEPTNANTDPDLAAGDIWIDITTYVNPLGQTRTKDLSYVWTGSAWEQVDHADAINNASTVMKGGLIATQKIILADGGGSFIDLDGASAPNSARIEMNNASIIGYSSGGTSSNEQFRIDADTGKAYFGGGANAILSSEGIQLGHATFGSAPFSVTPAGALTAESGEIGGWTIDSTSIFTGEKDTYQYATNNGDITFYSSGGNASIHSKNFYIDTSGNAFFKGDLSVGGSSSNRLNITSSGISQYKDGNLTTKMAADGSRFITYGTGGGADTAAMRDNSAIQVVNNGYTAFLSAGASNSDMRYDAAIHYLYNFGTNGSPGFGIVYGLKYLRFDKLTGDNNLIWSNDDLIIGTQYVSDDIYLKVGGVTKMFIESNKVTLSDDLYTDHLYPNTHNTYSLGSDTNRYYKGWFVNLEAAAYVTGDMTLNNLNLEANSFDGTRGHWFIQEGANDLFIENKLTGKKYKFKLEEV